MYETGLARKWLWHIGVGLYEVVGNGCSSCRQALVGNYQLLGPFHRITSYTGWEMGLGISSGQKIVG